MSRDSDTRQNNICRFPASPSVRTREKGNLPLEVQCAIATGLRESYSSLSNGIPPRFWKLWGKLATEPRRAREASGLSHASEPAKTAALPEALACKGPEALAILGAAFDEAWGTLCSIGNKSRINREQLARQVLDLFEHGECHPGRLASRSLIRLLASEHR
jgi:hypothetical protein